MEQATIRDLQAALNRKSGFEVLDHVQGETQLRIMGRQRKDAMGVSFNNWLLVVKNLLESMTSKPWKVDVSKQYVLRGGQVNYAWRLIFQTDGGTSINLHLDDIVRAILEAKHTARGELTEITLPGTRPGIERNVGRNGKGASTIKDSPFLPGKG